MMVPARHNASSSPLFYLLLLLIYGFAFSQSEWVWRNPSPSGNGYYSVTYAAGKFVAVGGWGTIAVSYDGATWAVVPSKNRDGFEYVTYGSGKYVAVGYHGAISVSPDGVTWSTVSVDTSYDFCCVAHGSGKFVAVGIKGRIMTSSDGMTWASVSSGTSFPNDLRSITYGADRFVAVGWAGTIITSTDGITWTVISQEHYSDFRTITYGANRFLASGNGHTFYSTDGLTWTEIMPEGGICDANAYCAGRFVAVGDDGTISTSIDGTSWTIRYSRPIATYGIKAIAYGADKLVAVGPGGMILTSSDDSTWENRSYQSSVNTKELYSIAYGADKFVAVGEAGMILISPDGVSWTHALNFTNTTQRLRTVFYNGNTFVALGDSGICLTSIDGKMWNGAYSSFFDAGQFKPGIVLGWSTCIAYGAGRFVAVGWVGDRILTSGDGLTWVPIDSFYYGLNSATFGAGKFVIASNDGFYTSPDGLTWAWTRKPSGTAGKCPRSVIYAADRFVAVGDSGLILTSSDGIVWTSQFMENDGYLACPFCQVSYFNSVVFGAGKFAAVGETSTIITSNDATTWVKADSVIHSLASVAYGANTFVAVGRGGSILTSMADSKVVIKKRETDAFPAQFFFNQRNGSIKITMPGKPSSLPYTIRISSVSGRTMYVANPSLYSNELCIPTNNIAKGVYIISISTKESVSASRVTIM